ncbi:hypothetical protein GCM10022271_17590 [Corallibacter vietnamensis]|uniref:Glycosyltransferase 2-like domain-containing protein n=1 Tax=Corallibacter vietnamensis TaxID=904130 RepID=A0ABP7HDB5_9FLAO
MQKTCIIVPCYNEASRFPLKAFQEFLKRDNTLDFCFVNDGSKDATAVILESLKKDYTNVTVFNLDKNKGKAEAIRYAVHNINHEHCNYIGYLDADLSTSLNEMLRLTNFISPKTQFIMGSRIKTLNTTIKRHPLRHILGRVLATVTNIMILKLPIYDTQCGAKLIKTSLAVSIFKEPFVSKWLFDIELLLRSQQILGNDFSDISIAEVPLQKWFDKGDSRITWVDFIRIPLDLIKIRNKYR